MRIIARFIGLFLVWGIIITLLVAAVYIQPLTRWNYDGVGLKSNQSVTVTGPACNPQPMTITVLALEKNLALVEIDGVQQEAAVFQPLMHNGCEVAFVDTIQPEELRLWTPLGASISPAKGGSVPHAALDSFTVGLLRASIIPCQPQLPKNLLP